MKKVKIYIATHKEAEFPNNSIYVPIEVGAYSKKKFTKITDDTGDNISSKNPNYCELTATYWIMKNDKSDIVGLTHYRRYFFKNHTNRLDQVLRRQDIMEYLKDYDMIVPNKTYLLKYKNIKEAYYIIHKSDDWEVCKNILKEKYPDYLEDFEEVEKSRSFYACNMFISSKKIFDDYYHWLFDILFELERRIDISSYDDYNKRIFGFMSERLFNVWVHHQNLKLKEVPVYNINKSIVGQDLDYLIKKLMFH